MNIYECNLWISDLDKTLDVLPELNELSGHSMLVTGASGLICSAIVDVLIRYNETHKGRITIFVAGRSAEKMKKRFAQYYDKDYLRFYNFDSLKDSNELPDQVDYIIHGAGIASPNKYIEEPVETMIGNFAGMRYLLDYARKATVKRVLYVSSSEVYGIKTTSTPFSSNEYGFVDILNPRSSYSVTKRATETLCASYSHEYRIDTVIVRPGHVYGPTATENDKRVSSMWPREAAHGMDIIMKSKGTQVRSYCYCLDCASAILKVLLKGKTANAYNISNPESIISIRDLAEIVACAGEVNLKLDSPDEKEQKGFNPMDNSSLDSSELVNLGWRGAFDAKTGLMHTVSILKELYGST